MDAGRGLPGDNWGDSLLGTSCGYDVTSNPRIDKSLGEMTDSEVSSYDDFSSDRRTSARLDAGRA